MKAMLRKAQKRGFTLIELMIVVAIIGILAVLAIYGVSRYLKTSKTAEATGAIGQIIKNAQEASTREKVATASISVGTRTNIGNCLCNSASKVPTGTPPASQKYQSQTSDWGGDATTGWVCLRFTMDQPQYYQYEYVAGTGCPNAPSGDIDAFAYGDLDGNGTTSTFDMKGTVQADKSIAIAPAPVITNETE